MRQLFIAAVILGLSGRAQSACGDFGPWIETGCRHLTDTYLNGTNAVLVSGYEWHLPSTWSPERRAMENERAWGGGWARSLEQPNGDTESVYFLVFRDSHRQAEYNVGYTWSTYWFDRGAVQPGFGFTASVIKRPDIASSWPVPVVLPIFSLRYRHAEVLSTYIPKIGGGINHGDVLYVFGKINLQ